MPRRIAVWIVALAAVLASAASARAAVATPRVVGGQPTGPTDYPAVASIDVNSIFGCTGTLVAPDWVLTAAHCSTVTGELVATPIASPGATIKVLLGSNRTDGAGATTYGVDTVKVPAAHQGLGADAGSDIALLHLTARPPQAPVPVAGRGEESLWAPGVNETIVGFGATSDGGRPGELEQVATVPIAPDAACAQAYPGVDAATEICAGFKQGGADTCQGDSGGPLFGHAPGGALRVVGTTSYGQGCGQTYGVYGRVGDATLREWIRSIVPAAVAPDAAPVSAAPAPAPAAAKAKAHKKKAKAKPKKHKRAKAHHKRHAAKRHGKAAASHHKRAPVRPR